MKIEKAKAGASVPATQTVKAAKGGMVKKDRMASKGMKPGMGKVSTKAGKLALPEAKKVVGAANGGMVKKKGC